MVRAILVKITSVNGLFYEKWCCREMLFCYLKMLSRNVVLLLENVVEKCCFATGKCCREMLFCYRKMLLKNVSPRGAKQALKAPEVFLNSQHSVHREKNFPEGRNMSTIKDEEAL